MTELFRQILAQRGLDESFLCPHYGDLFDPFLMKGVKAAVARIAVARDQNEKILIFGDYDADGVTASVVMQNALRYFGCEQVEIMLPNRFRDGYGMQMNALERIVASGASLVVTVDNGSGSGEVVAALKERNIDVIVTDHHEIPKLPGAVAVINPKRADEVRGKELAGVGVAFMLARALNMAQHDGKCDGQEKWLLDLVLIGTLCDSMTLRKENRILTYFGQKVIAKTRWPGLKELALLAGVDLKRVTAHAIGFQIGPRINAAGRLDDARVALELLVAQDRAAALTAAARLEELNQERRKLQEVALGEALAQIDDTEQVVVVAGNWHEGVTGIVAGHLLERLKRPAIVLTHTEQGALKGSGRSFGEFSLAAALRECQDLLINGGGHAQACGLSILPEQLDAFQRRINQIYQDMDLQDQQRFLAIQSDIEVERTADLNDELYEEICQLEPFGEGNVEPVFELTGLIRARRILKEKHLSIVMRDREGGELRLMAFFAPDEWLGVEEGQKACAQFTLVRNEWNGRNSIEGRLVSLALK